MCALSFVTKFFSGELAFCCGPRCQDPTLGQHSGAGSKRARSLSPQGEATDKAALGVSGFGRAAKPGVQGKGRTAVRV